jgi:hypothetical protein
MRSLALTALLGSFVATTSLPGQSLTEHAAAAAGATIGTAAGKPLGTSLGRIFNEADKTAATAASPKTTKPAPTRTTPAAPDPEHPATVVITATGPGVPAGGGGGEAAAGGGSGHSTLLARHTSRRKEAPIEAAPVAAAPITSILEPVNALPVVKEPSAQDLAGIHVGFTANELHAALGTPESKVTIPDDDGHLLEICQYWAKGEPLGTVRLDNGRVVSIQMSN